jgi:ribonuclease HI
MPIACPSNAFRSSMTTRLPQLGKAANLTQDCRAAYKVLLSNTKAQPLLDPDLPKAMGRRHKKKISASPTYVSLGALPDRLLNQVQDQRLIFTDASLQHHGGLAAVLFESNASEPEIVSATVPPLGSNQLEFQALLFGLTAGHRHFSGQPFVLFSDNHDAVVRIQTAISRGLQHDPGVSALAHSLGFPTVLESFSVRWIKSHATSRGNQLADLHARKAAQCLIEPDQENINHELQNQLQDVIDFFHAMHGRPRSRQRNT